MPEVRCTISNCTYWADGCRCSAEAILVDIDAHAGAHFLAKAGVVDNAMHHDYAATNASTMCFTFKAKSE